MSKKLVFQRNFQFDKNKKKSLRLGPYVEHIRLRIHGFDSRGATVLSKKLVFVRTIHQRSFVTLYIPNIFKLKAIHYFL